MPLPSRHVDGLAEEQQRRRLLLLSPARTRAGAGPRRSPAAAEALVAVDGEEREGEGERQVVRPRRLGLRLRQPVERRAEAQAVEAAVPAERGDDGAGGRARGRRRRRGADVAEAQRLPDGVAARHGGPQAAHAGGRGQRAPVQARQDLGQDVGVVVDVVAAAVRQLDAQLQLRHLARPPRRPACASHSPPAVHVRSTCRGRGGD
jgi:hypothetical protein